MTASARGRFRGFSRPDIIEAAPIDQQAMIEQARQSPLFAAIMGGREAGEEAIARTASATGGLRSGGAQEAFYDYNTQLENRALLSSYDEQRDLEQQQYGRGQQQYGQEFQQYSQQLGGLQGLAQLPSSAERVAQMTGDIGRTQAQGITGAAQARESGQNQFMGNVLGLGALAFSDIRLKDNVEFLKEKNGHRFYTWDWNSKAEKLGLVGKGGGVMAHEVAKYLPQAIGVRDDYITVDYSLLEAA